MATKRKLSSSSLKDLPQFFKSRDFSKALMTGIAITTPVIIGLLMDEFEVGLALCFGAFWCSPSDVSGNFRHKRIGILFSAGLIVIVSLIGGYLDYESWISLAILGVLSFAIAFISVYGFRASLISFSGLFALILSFANDREVLEIWQYSLLVGLGGLWYLLLTIVWHRLSRKAQTEEIIAETYLLTADFLETRSLLVDPAGDRKGLQSKLHEIQIELIEHHATLREILILSRQKSGKSNYEGRRLLIFAQLIEMLETATANPVNYDKMDALFKENPQYINSFQELITEMVIQLRLIANAGADVRKLPGNKRLTACSERVETAISEYGNEAHFNDYAGYAMLKNLLEYQEKQISKIKRIKWLLGNPDMEGVELIDKSVSKLFIAAQDYDPAILVRNLSFRSSIFKHSLRLSVTLMVGCLIGISFDSQTPYWILLTIIVIMRPGYALTKSRSKDRIIGTLIGALIALILVFIVRNPYAYGLLAVVSLIISLSMVQRNYRASATFVTLSVVFIYAITRPDILNVIQFRILDTAIAAALSYTAMRWLWPAWGFLEINKNIENSVRANKNFLGQIADFYRQKGQVPITYRVSRKEAFLETSNLSSAFQRMAQEPKSKRVNLPEIYELVELNHTFLSALASLSSYIQSHQTTSASQAFSKAIAKIDHNLEEVLLSLTSDFQEAKVLEPQDDSYFKDQMDTFQKENMPRKGLITKSQVRALQEAHLVWEQTRRLYSLSYDMLKITSAIRFD